MTGRFVGRGLLTCALVFLSTGSACRNSKTADEHERVRASHNETTPESGGVENVSAKIEKTDKQWCEQLTPEQYRVTRQGGTEPAFTGGYHDFKGEGAYVCICCGNELFRSETKFDSGSGWPSFWAPATEGSVVENTDRTHGMVRIEIKCSSCDAHLGHVFEDGPPPTGLRYCINSVALDFKGKK